VDVCRYIAFSALRDYLTQIGGFLRYLKPQFLDELSESCALDEEWSTATAVTPPMAVLPWAAGTPGLARLLSDAADERQACGSLPGDGCSDGEALDARFAEEAL
jgi:hypothetical protein